MKNTRDDGFTVALTRVEGIETRRVRGGEDQEESPGAFRRKLVILWGLVAGVLVANLVIWGSIGMVLYSD